MASDIFAFYASHSPMTDPGEASKLIEPLPNNVASLTRVIQGLGIYDVQSRAIFTASLRSPADRRSGNPFALDR